MPNDPPKTITQHANGVQHTYTYQKSEPFICQGKKWIRYIYIRDDADPSLIYGDTRLMTFTNTGEKVPDQELRQRKKKFTRSKLLRDYIRKYGERP